MGKSCFASVDHYIASQPQAVQGALEQVRSIIRKAVPDAHELISYDMPSYELHGVGLLHFAGWKQHYSLYLASASIVAAFEHELAPYDVQKGTVSFPLSEPVPPALIERIVRFRAKQVAARKKGPGA